MNVAEDVFQAVGSILVVSGVVIVGVWLISLIL